MTCDFNFSRPLANALGDGVPIRLHRRPVNLYRDFEHLPELHTTSRYI